MGQSDLSVPRAGHVAPQRQSSVCLIGASHYDDDARLFHRHAVSLSMRYNVEVLAAGEPSRRIIRNGVTVTTYGPRMRATYLRTLLRIFLHLRSARFDILQCGELESLIVAVIVSRLSIRHPLVVYDAHEYFPSLVTSYFRSPRPLSLALEFLLNIVERFLASFCDAFVVVNEDLARRFSVFQKPLVIVRNVPSLAWFDQARTVGVLQDVDCSVVISTGAHPKNGLLEILQAKSLLSKAGMRACFILAGRPPQSYRGLLGHDVRFEGWIEYDLLPSFLRRASIGLALYTPAKSSSKTMYQASESSKLYDYMMAGLPIVATDLPAIRAIVSRENCGVLVSPGDAEALAGAIAKLLDDENARASMAKRARQAAEREYNWEKESQRLLSLYDRIETKYGDDRRIVSVPSSGSLGTGCSRTNY